MALARRRPSNRGRGLAATVLLLALAGCGDDDNHAPRGGDAGDSGPREAPDSGPGATDGGPEAQPISFAIDHSLTPSADDVGTLDGEPRRMAVLEGPDGAHVELVEDELLVSTGDDAMLDELLQRRNGTLLWKLDSGLPGAPVLSLVRIEPGPADPEGLAQLVEASADDGMGAVGGEHRASDESVLGLLMAALQESEMLGVEVSPNVVMDLAGVGDGSTTEANDLGSTMVERDACTWPYMKSGGAQDIGVCDAWQALVDAGGDDNRVDVVAVDQGFSATPDTPQGSTFYAPGTMHDDSAFWMGAPGSTPCPESSCKWHGTWSSSALGAVPDNAWGSAGPGGLVARITHLDVGAALAPAVLRRVTLGAATLDQLQAAVLWLAARGLPPRVIGYVGMRARLPIPVAQRVVRSTGPLFALARSAGVLAFAPAGNQGSDVDHSVALPNGHRLELSVDFPCEMPDVVCVGGLEKDGTARHPRSNFGSAPPSGVTVDAALGTVDIYAPFDVLVGPDPDTGFDANDSTLRWRSGTSLAAPFAAGVASLIWAADPSLRAGEVEQALLDGMHRGSSSPEVPGWVDAAAAVQGALCASPRTYYRDGDGDGFGDPNASQRGCGADQGYVTDATDCDDGDANAHPGATEVCDGRDQNCTPDDEEGVDCDDGLFCTRTDRCDAQGQCVGTGAPCDASQVCNEVADDCGGCAGDADCDDGEYCNGSETCDAGNCVAGVAPALSDGVGCTDDLCNEGTDSIEHQPDDGACDDGLYCDGTETCSATNDCQPGTPPGNDGIGCTIESCDESTDTVAHIPNDSFCPDNGVYCDGTPVCSAQTGCGGGTPPCSQALCNETFDNCNPCTQDVDCDDLLYCNGVETCNTGTGACVPGTAPTGPDAVACTSDVCDEATDAFDHLPNDALCGDALFCNGDDYCDAALGCLVAPTVIDDGVDCTTDACVEASDSIAHTASDASCSDDLFCNGVETCDAIDDCQPGTPPTPTNDTIACTVDVCNENSDGFDHVPNDGYCNDDLFCNGVETCSAASGCVAGSNPCSGMQCNEAGDACAECVGDGDCMDADPCTSDQCNAGTCQHVSGGSDWYADLDGDGYGTTWVAKTCVDPGNAATVRGDCNDASTAIHPGASEQCNGSDEDCDGVIDDGLSFADYFSDDDGDGTGGSFWARMCGAPGSGYSTTPGDCNDGVASIEPGAPELCNDTDDDCDGLIDDGLSFSNRFYDGDGDGYGTGLAQAFCGTPPQAWVALAGDCNDGANGVHPGVAEQCNDQDDDCDGVVDDGLVFDPYFYDDDGDGYGAGTAYRFCGTPPASYVVPDGDCNDGATSDHPGATETCDGIDNDCDGATDDGLAFTQYFQDPDGDGYGSGTTQGFCSPPLAGWDVDGGDCNEGATNTHPGAAEICDAVDNDCDGVVDDGPAFLDYFFDSDGDGYGSGVAARFCTTPPANWVAQGGDCGEGSIAFHPGAPEVCDGADNDCDGVVDDGLTFTDYYTDGDGDGCGGSWAGRACAPIQNTVANADDCDDGNDTYCASCPDTCGTPPYPDTDQDGTADCLDCAPGDPLVAPGIAEVCDGIDQDCDRVADDGLTFLEYFYDGDGDGYGAGTSSRHCSDPGTAWVLAGGDCDDGVDTDHPSAAETCDGADDDCDGVVDEDLTYVEYFYDGDGDGYGAGLSSRDCAPPGNGWITTAGDCNDGSMQAHPAASELCNGVDDDCDGTADEDVTFSDYFFDSDGDGYGGTSSQRFCDPPSGWILVGGDCNQSTTAVHPGASELCNGGDDDCDGVIDDGIALAPYFYDGDLDGYGGGNAATDCAPPGPNWITQGGDCADNAMSYHPGAAELCDGADNDCDGVADDGLSSIDYFYDGDQDGYGGGTATRDCAPPGPNWITQGGDCADGAMSFHPGAAELCDDADNDCNGHPDDGIPFIEYFYDGDADGYGTGSSSRSCADPGATWSEVNGDCNDGSTAQSPAVTEICDGVDNDCDTQINENLICPPAT